VCASFHHLRSEQALPKMIGSLRTYSGIDYYHVKTCRYRKNNIFRLINMLGYTARAGNLHKQILNKKLPRPDIIIASCAHIFSMLAAFQLKKNTAAKIVYEVRDIWPLSLIQLAGTKEWNPLILWMKRIERKAYRKSDAVVSLLPNAMEHMAPLGLEASRFHYVPNGFWFDEWDSKSGMVPVDHQKTFDWCTRNKKLKVVYTGSHGPPNALEQLLLLKTVVKSRDLPYHFILIGDGILKPELAEAAHTQNITYLSFLPKVGRESIPAILEQADVCFLGWQDRAIYNLGISPNKLCDYFMAAKPVLHAYGGKHDPVAAAGAGITIEPFNALQLDSELIRFCRMTDLEKRILGQNGRQYALNHLEWSVLGEKYHDLCKRISLVP
jgi:glycosyltransferase involved in cell wall biosynthesis